MVPKTAKAIIVTVAIEQRASGMYYATSKDLRGLYVASRSKQEVLDEVPEVIEALFAASGEVVMVFAADHNAHTYDDNTAPWVAIPAHIARQSNHAC